LACRTISGIYTCNAYIIQLLAFWILGPSAGFWHLQQQCLHHPAPGILDPWPVVRLLASESSNAYIIQLLAPWNLGPSAGFWHLQQQCLHHQTSSF
jgi:hypothetical protein